MPSLFSFWNRLDPAAGEPQVDRFHVRVVTHATELEFGEILPLEIRYVLASRPSRHEMFRALLEQGYGIGIRSVDKTPERLLLAVERISQRTQHNTVVPWLEDLLRREESPVFSDEEVHSAEAEGMNLYEEVQVILSQRFEFKKIILVPLHNQVISADQQALLNDVNADLYPYAIDVIVNRVMFDNAHTRTEVAQSIIKALLIIGPIAHILEHFLSGIGKAFAAISDDLLSEAAELFALRGSGFTWRQLMKRSRILIVVLVVAVWAAFQVEPLAAQGDYLAAGVVFGLSAVALSLTTAIQSIRLYHQSYADLLREGKMKLEQGHGLWWHAIHQDFTNPARLGLFAGAATSPFLAALVFSLAPTWTHNGWVLALLGSAESVVAGLTVIAASRINQWRFRTRVRRVLKDIIGGSTSPRT